MDQLAIQRTSEGGNRQLAVCSHMWDRVGAYIIEGCSSAPSIVQLETTAVIVV